METYVYIYIRTIQHKTAILLSRKLAVFIVHTLSPLLIRLLLAFGLVIIYQSIEELQMQDPIYALRDPGATIDLTRNPAQYYSTGYQFHIGYIASPPP